jgi:Mg/Co/Ni transporter MgtE
MELESEAKVKELRQSLLSATVENKAKDSFLAQEYEKRSLGVRYEQALSSFNKQMALHEVLEFLFEAREQRELNNNNIPNLVENYFFEMNIVIRELARVLAPTGISRF